MELTYLYYLVGTGPLAGHFKIGMSSRPYARQWNLRQDFDFERSLKVGYPREQAIEKERALHRHFDQHRVELVRRPGQVNNADGYTEWFSMDCFAEATQLMKGEGAVTAIEKIEKDQYRMTFDLDKDIHRSFKIATLQRDETMGDVLRRFIVQYVTETGKLP